MRTRVLPFDELLIECLRLSQPMHLARKQLDLFGQVRDARVSLRRTHHPRRTHLLRERLDERFTTKTNGEDCGQPDNGDQRDEYAEKRN
jgi:hypothetical protein